MRAWIGLLCVCLLASFAAAEDVEKLKKMQELERTLEDLDLELPRVLGPDDVRACEWRLVRARLREAARRRGPEAAPRLEIPAEDLRRLRSELAAKIRARDPDWDGGLPAVERRLHPMDDLHRAANSPTPPRVMPTGTYSSADDDGDDGRFIGGASLVAQVQQALEPQRVRYDLLQTDVSEHVLYGLWARETDWGHQRIDAVLAEVRAAIHLPVDVSVALLRLDAAAVDELRRGGLEGQVLTEPGERLFARWAASEAAVATGQVRIAWGQRALLRQGPTRTFAADIAVEQCNSVLPVLTPVIGTLNLGTIVGLQVYRAARAEAVLVDIDATFNRMSAAPRKRTFEGGEIELPQIEQTDWHTTALIPLGRRALIGGVVAGAGGADPAGSQLVLFLRPALAQ